MTASRTWLATALFQVERNPAVKDQAWFDFLGKADLMIEAMRNRCSKCGGGHGNGPGEGDCSGPPRPEHPPKHTMVT